MYITYIHIHKDKLKLAITDEDKVSMRKLEKNMSLHTCPILSPIIVMKNPIPTVIAALKLLGTAV
jgi:hypothetical protein